MTVLQITKDGGIIYHAMNVMNGLVEDENDLDNVPETAAAGSRFHTAGYTQEWEKGEDGNWTEINPAPDNG